MKALEIKRENRYDSAMIMRQVLKTAVARVQEREAEEVQEQKEASEIIRRAKTSNSDQELAEAKRRDEELQRLQLREAEQQRIAAEEKAKAEREAAERAQAERLEAERLQAQRLELERAEAERVEAKRAEAERAEAVRVARETVEAARLAAVETPARHEDFLEVPIAAEVMAYRDASNDVDEYELAAVLEELEKAERGGGDRHDQVAIHTSHQPSRKNQGEDEVEFELDAEAVQVFERPLDRASETDTARYTEDGPDLFSETEKPGYSLPVPAIAGAIGLVVVVAVGAWFIMSGSSQSVPPPQAVQQQVVQPSEPQPAPSPETITPTETQSTETAAVDTILSAEQPTDAAPKAAPTAKPKKADAKKEPEKKKAVTADDLINDN
jgi:hypothetical protein